MLIPSLLMLGLAAAIVGRRSVSREDLEGTNPLFQDPLL
jgi:hypothetical protein